MSCYDSDPATIDRLSETRLPDMDHILATAIRRLQHAKTGVTGYNPLSDMDPRYAWLRRAYVRDAIKHLNDNRPLPEPRGI